MEWYFNSLAFNALHNVGSVLKVIGLKLVKPIYYRYNHLHLVFFKVGPSWSRTVLQHIFHFSYVPNNSFSLMLWKYIIMVPWMTWTIWKWLLSWRTERSRMETGLSCMQSVSRLEYFSWQETPWLPKQYGSMLHVDDSFQIMEHNQHCFDFGFAHVSLLGIEWTFSVPFGTLPFGLRIVHKHLRCLLWSSFAESLAGLLNTPTILVKLLNFLFYLVYLIAYCLLLFNGIFCFFHHLSYMGSLIQQSLCSACFLTNGTDC